MDSELYIHSDFDCLLVSSLANDVCAVCPVYMPPPMATFCYYLMGIFAIMAAKDIRNFGKCCLTLLLL